MMSVRMSNWAFEAIAARKLSASARLVLLALCHRHHDRTGRCDPSLKTIADMTDVARSKVARAVDELEEKGFIQRVSRSTRGGRISNQYIIGGVPSAGLPLVPKKGLRGGVPSAGHDREEISIRDSKGEILRFPAKRGSE